MESLNVFEDHRHAGEWRVEYQDADGACYVVIFSGPRAERRALDYYNALGSKALNNYASGCASGS